VKKVNWSKWNAKTDNFKKYSHIKSHLVYGELIHNPGLASIVIITYKRSHGLKIALESALNQNYENPYQITVVDDSGFDQATDDLMKEYCEKYTNIVYYRHEKNLGQYANWNRACELSPTEWFCLLHDDDFLKENYLSETVKVLQMPEYKDIGLLGVYFKTVDNRQNHKKSVLSMLTDTLTYIFVMLRAGKPIPIRLTDNIKLIYVLSCCLMINKQKVIDIGGLDDSYFPSADFILSSKMNYYYSTLFLPKFLCFRGIGENESLKQEVCEDSITCAYNHTIAMLNTISPSMSSVEKEKKASFAALAAEIGVRGYNASDYSHIKNELGMKDFYNTKRALVLTLLRSRLYWGLLLFRKRRDV
jgi:glycosyltransferase involved in cell wall biosynthesis